MKRDLDKLIRDPERAFEEPRELIERSDLSTNEKILVLESWQSDLIELQKAVEENMISDNRNPGETAARLAQVTAAITNLREKREMSR